MPETAPWRDREQLTRWLTSWRASVLGRAVQGLSAGNGWATLRLTGVDRASLFLGAMPGAVVLFPYHAPLPNTLRSALPATRRNTLPDLLPGARLTGAALLADDLVLQLTLTTSAGPRFLRHQLFGSRGGLAVLAADGRLLWTAYPAPHPCLLDIAAPMADHATSSAAITETDTQTTTLATPDDRRQTTQTNTVWPLTAQQRLARQLEISLGDRLQKALDRRLTSATRLIENLSADLAHADTGQKLREDAETLAAHLHLVPRGAESITCSSPHDGAEQTIALDPALSAPANLDRLFHQARKAQRGRQIIAGRLEEARRRQAALEKAAAELASCLCEAGQTGSSDAAEANDERDRILARLDCLQTLAEQCRPLLREARSASSRPGPDEPSRPFRRYMIDGRWEVWIGRNSRENDTLTHRASHLRDLWLHAQSVEGSHVVIRTEGKPAAVPRRVIEQAAALAALFSKARHSSLVPVIWTERRYVRRPRGAAPGTAVCLRAESLFAAPAVAPGVEPI